MRFLLRRCRCPASASSTPGGRGVIAGDGAAYIPVPLAARTFRAFVFAAPDAMTSDLNSEAEARYREAVARRDAIVDAWIKEGSPLLGTGSTGQLIEHPYVRMLRAHDLLVDRLAASVRKRHRGPNPSAVISPSIGESPAAKLRAVG